MKLFDKLSLRLKILIYFIMFTVIVFLLLWLFQVLFLENFYEKMKVNDVRGIAAEMTDDFNKLEYKDYSKKISELAGENEMCVVIMDRYGRSIFNHEAMGNCLIHGRYNVTMRYLFDLQHHEDGEICAKGEDLMLYACILGPQSNPEGYLFINSKLAPVGPTVSIIKRQLMIITAILIIIAFFISLYVSEKIAAPIIEITESAGKLAQGDYTTEFVGGGYSEAGTLAATLNYARREISKVDTLQRDLISNVSHDLRTPLTMLKAYAEMIRDLSGDNPVKRAEHLGIIIDETDRLAMLVNDILDLSKLESGRQQLTYSEFGIKSKLNDIIDRYNGISSKMDYHIHFIPDDELTVCCDVVKIEQVIYNLISNAINYTGEDKNIYVKQINMADGVRIEVHDTGGGIEEDKISLIFDKYYRSENHRREVVGTGLGLSIVKAILKLHNFEYGIDSIIGKGSVFWFTIKTVNTQKTS